MYTYNFHEGEIILCFKKKLLEIVGNCIMFLKNIFRSFLAAISLNTSLAREGAKSMLEVTFERSGFSFNSSASYISLHNSMLLQGDQEGVFTAFESVKSKHDFRVATFLAPNFCSVCNNYMWGLVSQVRITTRPAITRIFSALQLLKMHCRTKRFHAKILLS